MAEGPDPVNRSSQDVSSHQEEQEPVVVEPDVTCGHCKRELNNPHLLCCLHSVCRECLPNMVVENVRLKCPQCGDTSTHSNDEKDRKKECVVSNARCCPVPNGPLARYIEGTKIVQKIANNVAIPCGNKKCKTADSPSAVYCMDCDTFLCERCFDGHEVMSLYDNHTVKTLEDIHILSVRDLQISPNATVSTCTRHKGKVLEYCCEKCDELMCQACAVDRKSSHIPVFLDDSTSHHQVVNTALQAAVSYQKRCEVTETKLLSWSRRLDEVTESTLCDIEKTFEEISQAVDKRKEEVRREFIAAANQKKSAIDSKLATTKREKDMSSTVQSSLRFLLSSGSNHDMIACRDLVRMQQSILTSKWHKEDTNVRGCGLVTFDPSLQPTLLKAIDEFGVVEDGACPVNCTVDPKPESIVVTGSNPVTMTLIACNSKNIRCTRGGDNVEAFLRPKPPLPGSSIKARVVDDENGQYTISFPITYLGKCELSILVNGCDVRGSPFDAASLTSNLPKLNKKVAELGTKKGSLNIPQSPGGPWGVAIAPSGAIFVADHIYHRIHMCNSHKKHVRTFGQLGSGYGQLKNPTGLAVDDNGLLYVANFSGNKCINVFREDGTAVRQIGAGQLVNPMNVTVHDDKVYVADKGNSRISIFTLEGQFIHTIGSRDANPGQFTTPTAVAFSQDGDMYVTDYSNRVQVFTPEGVYKREFGKGQLRNPLDILITADNNVLVADQSNSRIAIFSTTGQLIRCFAVGTAPYAVAVDYNGDFLVSLNGHKQVAVY